MKTLFLVRHAKSSWDNPGLSDEERPLNKRGQRDAPRMGRRLKSRGVSPDLLISSPAVRAHSTSVRIAAEIGYLGANIQIRNKLYFEGVSGVYDVIHSLDPNLKTVMLFGHNPTTTELVNELSNVDIDNVPTCGIAELRFDIETWSEVVAGIGEMVLFDYPKRVDD